MFVVRLTALALLAAGGLVACGGSGGDPTAPRTAPAIPAGATSVSYQVIEEATTSISGIPERRRVVISDAQAWAAFWDELFSPMQPRPDLPEVDFGSRMILAATMGQRSSGGYVISVEQVAEDGGTLFARVQETRPGPDCVTATVITAPAVAVSVPRHPGGVAFVETDVEVSCLP